MARILHIIDSLGHSGIANQMLLLARGLASHGYEVHVAVLNASSTIDRSTCGRDFPIINVGRRWSIDPLADLRLARHITKLQPEIVHTWNTIPGMFGPLAASFIAKRLAGNEPPASLSFSPAFSRASTVSTVCSPHGTRSGRSVFSTAPNE